MLFLANFADFRPILSTFPRSVTFLESMPDVDRICTTFPIIQDEILENMESFIVNLGLPEGSTGVRINTPVTEVFILDDNGKLQLISYNIKNSI